MVESADSSIGSTPRPKQDLDSKQFTAVLVWSLGRKNISINAIRKEFNVGWDKAKGFMERLYNLGIAEDKEATVKSPVLPTMIEDLPNDVVEFLERNGYLEEDIKKLLDDKN